MKYNVLAGVVVLLFQFTYCAAQQIENPAKSNVIPPSPTAASLGRYGDTPVSLYTGVPQINVPLWEVKERGFQLPITLNYQAGVRVEEAASWVGQGWSLSAGGVITRTVRGLPDEQDNGYSGFAKIGEKVEKYLANQMTSTEKQEFEKNVAEGIWDAEPDLYYFNFQGKSGKIIFDKDAVPTVIPAQKILVEGNILQGFSITTDDGTKYSFGEAETTERLDACDVQPTLPFNSSWYLTTIEKNGGFSVIFTYLNGLTYQNILPSETGFTLYNPGHVNCSGLGTQLGCSMILKMNTKRLSSIVTSGLSQIIFKSITQRTDLQSPSVDYRLDSIVVKQSGLVLKKIYLGYGSGGCGRLVLNSVQEISSTNETLPPYQFEYFNINELPCTTSKSQDHWGFYNGNASTTLIPQQFFINQYNTVVNLIGSDRSPNFNYAKIGTLNKIKYPTGGWTELTFESNEYGYRMSSGEVNDPKLTPATLSMSISPPATTFTGNFQIGTKQFVQVDYSVNYSSSGTYPDNGEYVRVKDASNNVILARSFGTGTAYLDLNPGVYTFEGYSANSATITQGTVTYKVTDPGLLKSKVCGGLRVKQITDHDGISELHNKVTIYKYKMEADTARSSGVIIGEPKYDYLVTKNIVVTNLGTGSPIEAPCDFVVRTANSNVLGTTQGSHVGYREVRVEQLNNGYSINRFYSPIEYPDLITFGYPFALGTSYDYQRGNLKQKDDYVQVSASIGTPVQKSTNTYAISQSNRKVIQAVKIGYVQSHPISSWLNTFSSIPYEHVSEWQYLSQSTTESFSTNGQSGPLTISKSFFYDNPSHMQLTSLLTKNGILEDVLTTCYYPAD
ncbi:MAG: hypothetical protein HYZ44_17400, partial [Bacteroidetes bacterium]|nr:hypothetical protein [Bacteroidota bacterium]